MGGRVDKHVLTKAQLQEVSQLPPIEQLRAELVAVRFCASGGRW